MNFVDLVDVDLMKEECGKRKKRNGTIEMSPREGPAWVLFEGNSDRYTWSYTGKHDGDGREPGQSGIAGT